MLTELSNNNNEGKFSNNSNSPEKKKTPLNFWQEVKNGNEELKSPKTQEFHAAVTNKPKNVTPPSYGQKKLTLNPEF